MQAIITLCTVPTIDKAKEIAKELISKKVAKCINIMPEAISIYEWDGKIHEEKEFLLIIKSANSESKDLEMLIKKLHPYEIPEIISLNINSGSAEYLSWLNT